MNHLAREKSPYLLQHAHNPVDWYPWGAQAFRKARAEDKPILLSIGYSTCHWCHVMERESFSDARIAKIMNRDFVNIKLDREERPEIDKIYMTAVQAMTGSGGWPLNVFLTPDLKPFFGGTYFPPEARWGQPGFPDLLARISELWRTHRQALNRDSRKLAEFIGRTENAPATAPDPAWLDRAFASYAASFDQVDAGFGGAPKFPMPTNHHFLLRYHARTGNEQALEISLATLRAMARGGIYDHVGGGFHRYATDGQWRVPHFEKMLYDNAQIAANYLEAFQLGGDAALAQVARETLDYVLRDMTHPEGGFYSAEDADSLAAPSDEHKAEGAFYLWTEAEVRRILGEKAELFIRRYGILPDGNAPIDPHNEFTGRNILYAAHSLAEAAARCGRGEKEAAAELEAAKAALLRERARRPRPSLDDKILASWNGLMISALAKARAVLDEPRYGEAAARAARFMKSKLFDGETGQLFHRWRDGERAVDGMADDYAFLVQGLLDLYEADFDPQWLSWALELAEVQNRLFQGPDGGFYMTREGHDESVIVRVMEEMDNVEPCASSVAALNLLRLFHLTGRMEFRAAAEKTLAFFGPRLRDRPLALPQMLGAVDFALAKVKEIVIAAESPDAASARCLLKEVRARFLPASVLLFAPNGAGRKILEGLSPFIKDFPPARVRANAYVCVARACLTPTDDAAKLAELLSPPRPARR